MKLDATLGPYPILVSQPRAGGISVLPSVIANTVAGLSFLLSALLGYFYIRVRRHAAYEVESSYSRELLEWHFLVVSVVKKLSVSVSHVESSDHQQRLAELSALIDQGRFYFPNIDRDQGLGEWKPPAFRGKRNLALDFLVALFNIYSKPLTPQRKDYARTLARHFTSIVFEILRPRERLERVRELTDRYFSEMQSFEDFVEHEDWEALREIWRT